MENSLKDSTLYLKTLLTVVAMTTVSSAFCQSFENPYPLAGGAEPRTAEPVVTKQTDELRDNGFFSYRVTGNPEVDLKLYHEAKAVFVENHPDRYQDMLNQSLPSGKIKLKKSDFDALPSFKQSVILSKTEMYEIED